jgi:hypothetical protein
VVRQRRGIPAAPRHSGSAAAFSQTHDSRSPRVVRAMTVKRRHPDADNVHRQPPQKVFARRSSASVLLEPKVELRKIPSDSRVWGMKATTCLSLGLDPSDINHKPVVCNNCTSFWETKLKYDISKYSKKPVSRRYLCERPFDCSDRVEKGKVHARDRMKRLFSEDGDL